MRRTAHKINTLDKNKLRNEVNANVMDNDNWPDQ